jgi:hypothetical protein
METKIEKTKNETTQDDQVKAILFLLESHLQSQLEEVKHSNTLMDLGAKTDLINEIESFINDPFGNVIGAAYSLNKTVLGLLNYVFADFFKQNVEIVQAAYLVPKNSFLLDYYVVLKADDEATLDKIYLYFAEYDQKHLSEIYPVRFNHIDLAYVSLLPSNRIQLI